jgi:hypothetical protein
MNGISASPVMALAALALGAVVAALGMAGIRRGGAARRGGRIAALAAALLGLLGLVLQPWRAAPPPAGRAVLITPGAGGPAGGLRLVEGDGGGAGRMLPDARTLWRNQPGLRRLEVRGYGLAEEDFEGFQGVVERFEPPALPPGVTAALWPRRLTLGAALRVEARVSPATVGRLELAGPGGVEAEVDAAAARGGATLTTVPRAAGRLLYRLVVRGSDRRELASEPLDVTVEPARPPAVLALFGAPGFEQQALLRWLAASGVPFVAREELTRGRARVAALWPASAGPQPRISALSAAGLARFDAVVADGRSFQALSPHERAELWAAIDAGLGLLVIDADPGAGEERGLPLRSRAAGGGAAREERLRWPGEEPLPALEVPGREIVREPAQPPEVESLVSDAAGRALAARVRRGRGWFALSLITASYPLRHDAGERGYGALWARLLGAVARPDPSARFELPMGPVPVGRPAQVELLAPSAAPPPGEATQGAGTSIPAVAPRVEVMEGGEIAKIPIFPAGKERFAVRLWPRREGWLRLSIERGTGTMSGVTAWIHASGGKSWDVWEKAARLAATYEQAGPRAATPPQTPASDLRRPWPRWPLYVLFLCGAGLLWLMERVRPAVGASEEGARRRSAAPPEVARIARR